MSKNFEQAYKRLAHDETPDLWDRIEAGLKEKSAPAGETQESRAYDNATKTENLEILENDDQGGKKIQSKGGTWPFIKSMKRYSGVAAAALCAAVIIPAALFLTQSGGGYSSSDAAAAGAPEEFAAETAAEERYESAETAVEERYESAEAAAEEKYESAAADEAYENAEAIAEELEKAPAGKSVEAAAEESSGSSVGTAMDDKNSQIQDLQSATQKSREEAGGLTTGTALNNIIIEVTDMISGNEGTWYTVLVREDPSGYLNGGERITIFAPLYSSIALEKAVFEVDVVCEEGEGYSFLLTGYHQKME